MLPIGSTIGIFGGGQLGRMTASAAHRLGYKAHIFCPEQDAPALDVTPFVTLAPYTNTEKLKSFAASVDVITLEFENIPVSAVEIVSSITPTFPKSTVLAVTQDRSSEKQTAEGLAVPVAPYRAIDNLQDLEEALVDIGVPALLKTRCSGYDGKGQIKIEQREAAKTAWETLGGVPCIVEGLVNFTAEISVLVAVGRTGEMVVYPVAENTHQGGILNTTLAPARLPIALTSAACSAAIELAKSLQVVGLLAVEFFVVDGTRILFNEMAPRPHNSFHWTMDGAGTCQFSQLVRCIAGLPLGRPLMRVPEIVMENLVGTDSQSRFTAALSDASAFPTWYGKHPAIEGRKMGHINRVVLY